MADHSYRSLSLERGLVILNTFDDAHPTRTIGELADALGLSRGAAHRYVATLVALDYLQRCPGTRKYRLGPSIMSLGMCALNTLEVRRLGKPHAEQLARDLGYTVTLAILVDVDIMEIEKVGFRASLNRQNTSGVGLPSYCTAQGKVLLAALPEAERRALIGRIAFTARAPRTIVTQEALLTELKTVARLGFAVNNEEFAEGLRGVAAPIRDSSFNVVAALGMSGHASQAPLRDLAGPLARHVQRVAEDISYELADFRHGRRKFHTAVAPEADLRWTA